MLLLDLFEREFHNARSFGIWLGRAYEDQHQTDAGIYNYDYLDDEKGNPLRYRMIVDAAFRRFIQEMTPTINAKGWHVTVDMKKGRNRWQIVFEPTLTARVPRGTVFWHLTPAQNVASILRDGLIPGQSRHGLRYPQNRVYLLKSEGDAERMRASFSHRDRDPIDYAVIKVDLRSAKGIRLHADPELAKVAVYTTDPIPARYVSQM